MKEYQKPMITSRGNVYEPVSPAAPVALGVGFLKGLMGDDYRPESMRAIQNSLNTGLVTHHFRRCLPSSVFPAISLVPVPHPRPPIPFSPIL